MKKLLTLALALILALGCMGAYAEEDLQAQLDEANAKIAELQALVDTYYPYYAANIVATYGENGIVWLDELQVAYETQVAQYAGMGIDLEAYGLADALKLNLIQSAVEVGVVKDKAVEMGLDQLSEETIASLNAEADALNQQYIDYYVSYFQPEAEEITDEIIAEAEAYWAETGFVREDYYNSLVNDAIVDAAYDYVTADVAITEEDIQAEYEAMVADAESVYSNDATYNSDRSNGVVAWNPEGYRAVKHVLIMFNEEQGALYDELQSQLDSLNAEKEAIENPTEEAEAAEETEERTIEQINSEIAACATEMEALYSQLAPTADEVIAAFNDGASFDELIEKYNQDPGMRNEPTASIGYAVAENSTYWDPAFTAGAMSIAEVGQISAPVYASNGIHIIYYLNDITPGAVALDEIREEVEANALSGKLESTYREQVAAWLEEANVEYFYESFGITAPAEEAAE